MPISNHKRKSFKSINHKTSRKSKLSTKHKSHSFRNKKTRSNLRKMRGGGVNYPDEYDDIVIRYIGGTNISKYNIYIATGYYDKDKNLITYNQDFNTFDNNLHTFDVILKNGEHEDISGYYKNINILHLNNNSEYFTIVGTKELEISDYTAEKTIQLADLQTQINKLQSEIEKLYITETRLQTESLVNNSKKTDTESELNKFKLNTNKITALQLEIKHTENTFQLNQLTEQLNFLEILVYSKSEDDYNKKINNLIIIIDKAEKELNNIPIKLNKLILERDTIYNELHLARETK